ncbi:hypothetical protein [Devosia sp. A449]
MTIEVCQTWLDFAPGKSAAAAARIKALIAEAGYEATLMLQCEIGMVNAILVLTTGGTAQPFALIEADTETAQSIRCSGTESVALNATTFEALTSHFATKKYALIAPAGLDTQGLAAIPLMEPPAAMPIGSQVIIVEGADEAVALAISRPTKPGQLAPSLAKAI